MQKQAEVQEIIEQRESSPAQLTEKINTVADLTAKYGNKKAKEILATPLKREKIVLEAIEIQGCKGNKTRQLKEIAKKHKITRETLGRWIKEYQTEGLIGLVHEKYRQPADGLEAKGRRAVNQEMRDFIIAMFLRNMKPKGSHIYEQLKKAAEIKGWKLPSKATIYRVIDEISKSEVVMAHKGKEAWKAEVKPKTKRTYDNLMVMQEIVGDGHKWDIFVNWEGRAIRAELSAWVDLRSRAIVGWCITAKANSESIGLALKHAIESYGLPGTIYTDNGKDYLSDYIEAVCKDLDIDIRNCIPKTPQSKLIERLFREVTDKFSRYQPGYCGNNPENRPAGFNQNKLLQAGKLMTIDELAEKFATWVKKYNNAIHGELKDTPKNVVSSVEHFRPGKVEQQVLQVLFMKRSHVKVHPGYIRLYGRDFWTFGTEIDWLVGKYVDVWYDFHNMGRVLIWYGGKIVGTAENKQALRHGEDRVQLAAEQKAKAKFEKETRRRIDEYAQRLGDDLDQILPEDVLNRKRKGQRYITGPDVNSENNVHRLTGHEKDAAAAAQALEQAANNPGPDKPAQMSRAKKMLLEEGRKALAQ
ncbi:mobile element protein [Desulfocucumis palustris]|uniref:Mobile element protein n=2 Tax=Desulfocucumis palustris TaxID=1898651 RepID=A0A2L2XEH8_9FIRM|nr:mobile element protein [Desulfocucumis palustris]